MNFVHYNHSHLVLRRFCSCLIPLLLIYTHLGVHDPHNLSTSFRHYDLVVKSIKARATSRLIPMTVASLIELLTTLILSIQNLYIFT